MRTRLLVCLLAVCSCSKSSKAPAPPPVEQASDPKPTQPAGPAKTARVHVQAESDTLDLVSGVAEWDGGALHVRLGEQAASCVDSSAGMALRFEVPRGPNGALATNRDVNVWVQLDRHGPLYYASLDPHHAVARLEPFEAKKGARVRGKLAFERRVTKRDGYGENEVVTPLLYKGAGDFDVELCGDAPADDVGEEVSAALAGKLGGTWSGKPLSLREGLAAVKVDPDSKEVYLESITFPVGEAVDCATSKTRPFSYLELNSMGGVSRAKPIRNEAQRVSVALNFAKGTHSYLFDQPGSRAWVRFEQLAWESGGEVKGTLVALSPRGAAEPFRILGTFTARICEGP